MNHHWPVRKAKHGRVSVGEKRPPNFPALQLFLLPQSRSQFSIVILINVDKRCNETQLGGHVITHAFCLPVLLLVTIKLISPQCCYGAQTHLPK